MACGVVFFSCYLQLFGVLIVSYVHMLRVVHVFEILFAEVVIIKIHANPNTRKIHNAVYVCEEENKLMKAAGSC